MIFPEKLQLIRKNRGMTREELAERLHVSQQAVAKWENGQSYPDILNLIQLSELFNYTLDYLVKDNDCSRAAIDVMQTDNDRLAEFLIEAKRNTYAGEVNQCASSRPNSHDYSYEVEDYRYIDTYLGGECFSGEEAVWVKDSPVFSMNYVGRVLGDTFSGSFLKEALKAVTKENPFRGPAFYQSGEYLYQSKVNGDLDWFQGYEEIYDKEIKVYECFYHGGQVR